MKKSRDGFLWALRLICLACVVALGFMTIVGTGGGGGGGDSSLESSESEFDEIVIGPQGGDFILANGIVLSIPQGAVPEVTTFQFRSVQETEFSMPTEYLRQYEKHFLAGIEAKPYGYTFNQPISISIPSAGLVSSTSLPYPLSLNTATNTLDPIAGAYLKIIEKEASLPYFRAAEDTFGIGLKAIYVNEDGLIEIPDLSGLPEDQKAIVLLEIEKIRAESDCVSNPCRCGRIKVESDDFDSGSSVSDGCYSVYSDGFVQYLDCPGQPIEPWSLHESNLDVTVIPNNEKIKVGEIVYFSISLTDEKSQPVTGFLIQELNIENSSVITQWNIGVDSIGIKGLSPGISSAEVIIQAGGCQYKGWLTVEVEESSIVLTNNNINIPEGESRMIGVKLSDPPPVAEEILVSALVGGDNSITVVSGMPMSFDNSNWDSYQYFLIAAGEDADTSNGVATITVMSNVDYYVAENIAVKEIDNDTVKFVTNTDRVYIYEGGSASFLVRLNKEPLSTVNVTVLHESGDPDISVTSGSLIIFNDSNWDIYQPVVLSAKTDEDTDNGTAQIKISTNMPDIENRLVTAVEVELDILYTSLAIEGSEDTGLDMAYWYGVVPITITTDPNNPCAGNIQGAGTLAYLDSYSYLTWGADGEGAQCYFQEDGPIAVSVEGYQDCANPPVYVVGAILSRNTTERTLCSDGRYSTKDNIGEWKSYAVYLESENNYTETYYDVVGHYFLGHYRVQLLSPPR